jgi:hypothetical protein
MFNCTMFISHKYFNYKGMDNMDFMEVSLMSQQIWILFKLSYLGCHMKLIQFLFFLKRKSEYKSIYVYGYVWPNIVIKEL